MTPIEMMIWSMAVGTIGAVVLSGLANAITLRSLTAAQGAVYHFNAMAFVFLLSGLAETIAPGIDTHLLGISQVLIGPLCSAIGNYWISGWFQAQQRDRFMAQSLYVSAACTPLLGMLCLLLPLGQQLPASAVVCTANTVLVLWLGIRAYMLGDKLALGVAIGGLLMVPAVVGLYAVAMGIPGIGPGLQAVFALCAALCAVVVGMALWQRTLLQRRTRTDHASDSQLDPVTKLLKGSTLIQKLIKAQRRRRRTRREGAVLAVLVFDTNNVLTQAGQSGLNQMYIQIANRIQRQVGVVNVVGRYYEGCFVTLVETLHSSGWMRTLGLRVASNLRQPIEVSALNGEMLRIKADIGVGVVHLRKDDANVDTILHNAERMAQAARSMLSRAAILDPVTGEITPIENANLGPRHVAVRKPPPLSAQHPTRPART